MEKENNKEIEEIRKINPAYRNPEEAHKIATQWINDSMKEAGLLLDSKEKQEEYAERVKNFLNYQLEQGIPLTEEQEAEILQETAQIRIILHEVYEDIIKVLKFYVELKEEYYSLLAIWIIGTHFHDQFETFPLMFINATRGSGKTRLLKLVEALSYNGQLLISLRESVLFRTAKDHTLCIDEFESLNSKENQALRELLNACYKKGTKVQRMKKVKGQNGETFEVESFEPYTSVIMANIAGIEEVLEDRAITLILEKTYSEYYSRILENFSQNNDIKSILSRLDLVRHKNVNFSVVSVVSVEKNLKKHQHIYELWNLYITTLTTLTTYITQTTQTTLEITQEEKDFFNKLYNSNIKSRDLEISFALLLIAYYLGNGVFDSLLETISTITDSKREEEQVESQDVLLINFIASELGLSHDYISINELTVRFRNYVNEEDQEERWLNTKWMGRALKRLNLIVDKRRLAKGREVKLNIHHAIDKMRCFKK